MTAARAMLGAGVLVAAPGIGFAIASNVVTDIAKQLIAHGHVVHSHRADLGVRVTTVLNQQGQPAGVAGVKVAPGGPAAAAGIQPGEVITQINHKKVRTTTGLADVLARLDPGQKVPLTVTGPHGKTRTVQVTLGQLPGS
jgi:S1-C subfamily serine protease